MVAVHAVVELGVTDDGLDSRAALHLAADGSGEAADLPRDPDPVPVRMVVATVSVIDVECGGPMSAITGPSVCPSKGLPCNALA